MDIDLPMVGKVSGYCETILQIPDDKTSDGYIPIIIVTHETTKNFLMKSLIKIEKLDFVLTKVKVITIDKCFD